ncbi:MAG: LysR family transcriptional regulator [Cephaloticoccus sp.]|nr:LysR family transcriptional regulator [Cephaloticoccus sp.]
MINDWPVMYEELFSRRGLSLDRVKTLCIVAECGGIAKAADGDPVRQSQFSRQLRELGEFFEVDLTRRRGKGVELTMAGKELAALGREVLEALGDFRRGVQGGEKNLRLGAGESLIQWQVLPQLKRLRKDLPGVLLSMSNLRAKEIINQLAEAQIDFGLASLVELPAGLAGARLGLLRYRIFVSTAIVTRKKPTWKEALKLPLVGLEGEGRLAQKISQVAARLGLKPEIAVRCSSLPGVATALKEIDGFAILPEAAAQGGLVAIEAPFLREFEREVHLVWSVRRLAIRDEMVRWRQKLVNALAW